MHLTLDASAGRVHAGAGPTPPERRRRRAEDHGADGGGRSALHGPQVIVDPTLVRSPPVASAPEPDLHSLSGGGRPAEKHGKGEAVEASDARAARLVTSQELPPRRACPACHTPHRPRRAEPSLACPNLSCCSASRSSRAGQHPSRLSFRRLGPRRRRRQDPHRRRARVLPAGRVQAGAGPAQPGGRRRPVYSALGLVIPGPPSVLARGVIVQTHSASGASGFFPVRGPGFFKTFGAFSDRPSGRPAPYAPSLGRAGWRKSRFRVRPSPSGRAARAPLHLYDAGGAFFGFARAPAENSFPQIQFARSPT